MSDEHRRVRRYAKLGSTLELLRNRAWPTLLAISVIGIACDDPIASAPEVPATYSIAKAPANNGDLQVDTVLATINPLRVVVRVDDIVTAGIRVAWLVSAGAVTDTLTTITDADGIASLALTLGTKPQVYLVRATLQRTQSGPSVTFTVTATAGRAAQLTITAGANQSDTATALLSTPYAVRVTDAYGNSLAGVPIDWAVTAGGGSISPAQSITSAAGEATARHTLGPATGMNEVAASALGIGTPVTFRATAVAARPTSLTMLSGNNQTAQVSRVLSADYVVRVTDSYGNPIAGVEIEWKVTSGGGALSSSTTMTGADGSAAIRLTLGATAGPQSVSATAVGLPNAPHVVFTATAVAPPPPPPPPPPPQFATLIVRVASAGFDVDQSLTIRVTLCTSPYPNCHGQLQSRIVGASSAAQFVLNPGEYHVSISDVALNCTVANSPTKANPNVFAITEVSFSVSCIPAGSIRVTTTTTGTDVPSFYNFTLNGQFAGSVGGTGNATLSVGQGTHSVSLSNVPANCTVAGSNPVSVTVTSGATTNVPFEVSCLPNPTLRVTLTTTGSNIPTSFYVGIDYHYFYYFDYALLVAANGVGSIRIPVGDHVVVMNPPVNCTVSGGVERFVTLVLGSTVDVSFTVQCF